MEKKADVGRIELAKKPLRNNTFCYNEVECKKFYKFLLMRQLCNH